MKTTKKQLHQRVLKLCISLLVLLSWSLSYGQSPIPSKTDYQSDRAIAIVSNNDNSSQANEFIYLRSGEDGGNRWMTDAQMVIGDDWVRVRKPLQFLTYNNSWEGYGEYMSNSKLGDNSKPFGLSFFTSNTERMRITNATTDIYNKLDVGNALLVNSTISSMFHNIGQRMGVRLNYGGTTGTHYGWYGTTTNHGLMIGTNNASALTIGTQGNIDVNGGLTVKKTISSMFNSIGQRMGIRLNYGGITGANYGWYGTTTNHGLMIGANNATALTINNDGDIEFQSDVQFQGDTEFEGDTEFLNGITISPGGPDDSGAYTYDFVNRRADIGFRQGLALVHGTDNRSRYKLQILNSAINSWVDGFKVDMTVGNEVKAEFFGKVGIGIGTPTTGLHIKDMDGLTVEDEDSGIKTVMTVEDGDTPTKGWIGTTTNHGLAIGTNNASALTIGTQRNIQVNGDLTVKKTISSMFHNIGQRMGVRLNYGGTTGTHYGWYGTTTNHGLAIGTNKVSALTISTEGNTTFLNTAIFKDNVLIGGSGTDSQAALHVKDLSGGIMYEKQGVKVKMSTNVDHNRGWIGTKTEHGLFLGTNNVGSNIYLDTLDNAFIGFENSELPDVSSGNLTNFDLMVDEGIIAEDLAIAERVDWADYVFDKEYKLKPLSEVKQFIEKNKHLPNIPSQKEVSEKGYSVHDINVRFLEKTEELVLYTIQQEEKIENQEVKIELQEEKIEELSKRLDDLAKMIAENK